MSNYPTSLPSATPADHAEVLGEVRAIAVELGLNPSGSAATVGDRFATAGGLPVPDFNTGYGPGFGVYTEAGGAVAYTVGNYDYVPFTGHYNLEDSNAHQDESVDNAYMTFTTGGTGFTVNQAGWYVASVQIQRATVDPDPLDWKFVYTALQGTETVGFSADDFSQRSSALVYLLPNNVCQIRADPVPSSRPDTHVFSGGFTLFVLTPLFPLSLT